MHLGFPVVFVKVQFINSAGFKGSTKKNSQGERVALGEGETMHIYYK